MIIQKKEGVNLAAAQQHISVATLKMEDANRPGNSTYTRFDAAYDAILRCAFAILELSGMEVSSDKGHHLVILEYLADKLAVSTQRAQALRMLTRTRNQNVYGGGPPTTEMMVHEAISLAERVCAETEAWIRRHLEEESTP